MGSVPGVSELQRAVATVVRDCLGVREREQVLSVCNPATIGLGERLRAEAGKLGADAVTALMAERPSHGAEPPATIAAAMRAADVVFCPTVQSLSHSAARREASEAGARIATLPGVTEEMLARRDERRHRRAAPPRRRRSSSVLTAGSEARITCANGSDLTTRARRSRRDPRRRRSDRPRRLRQPALR